MAPDVSDFIQQNLPQAPDDIDPLVQQAIEGIPQFQGLPPAQPTQEGLETLSMFQEPDFVPQSSYYSGRAGDAPLPTAPSPELTQVEREEDVPLSPMEAFRERRGEGPGAPIFAFGSPRPGQLTSLVSPHMGLAAAAPALAATAGLGVASTGPVAPFLGRLAAGAAIQTGVEEGGKELGLPPWLARALGFVAGGTPFAGVGGLNGKGVVTTGLGAFGGAEAGREIGGTPGEIVGALGGGFAGATKTALRAADIGEAGAQRVLNAVRDLREEAAFSFRGTRAAQRGAISKEFLGVPEGAPGAARLPASEISRPPLEITEVFLSRTGIRLDPAGVRHVGGSVTYRFNAPKDLGNYGPAAAIKREIEESGKRMHPEDVRFEQVAAMVKKTFEDIGVPSIDVNVRKSSVPHLGEYNVTIHREKPIPVQLGYGTAGPSKVQQIEAIEAVTNQDLSELKNVARQLDVSIPQAEKEAKIGLSQIPEEDAKAILREVSGREVVSPAELTATEQVATIKRLDAPEAPAPTSAVKAVTESWAERALSPEETASVFAKMKEDLKLKHLSKLTNSDLGLVREKVADRAIRNHTRVGQTAKQLAAIPESGKPPLPPAEPPGIAEALFGSGGAPIPPGAEMMRFFQAEKAGALSGRTALSARRHLRNLVAMGEDGAEIANRAVNMILDNDLADTMLVSEIGRIDSILSTAAKQLGLSRKQQGSFVERWVDFRQGDYVPVPGTVEAKAYSEADKIATELSDGTFDFLTAAGVKVKDFDTVRDAIRIKGWFPRIHKEGYFQKPENKALALQRAEERFISEGMAPEEAGKAAEKAVSDFISLRGPERQYLHPRNSAIFTTGYRKDLGAFHTALRSEIQKANYNRWFGQENALVGKAIERISAKFPERAHAFEPYIKEILSTLSGKTENGYARAFLAEVSAASGLSKIMGFLPSLQNLSELAIRPAYMSTKSFLKGLAESLPKEIADFGRTIFRMARVPEQRKTLLEAATAVDDAILRQIDNFAYEFTDETKVAKAALIAARGARQLFQRGAWLYRFNATTNAVTRATGAMSVNWIRENEKKLLHYGLASGKGAVAKKNLSELGIDADKVIRERGVSELEIAKAMRFQTRRLTGRGLEELDYNRFVTKNLGPAAPIFMTLRKWAIRMGDVHFYGTFWPLLATKPELTREYGATWNRFLKLFVGSELGGEALRDIQAVWKGGSVAGGEEPTDRPSSIVERFIDNFLAVTALGWWSDAVKGAIVARDEKELAIRLTPAPFADAIRTSVAGVETIQKFDEEDGMQRAQRALNVLGKGVPEFRRTFPAAFFKPKAPPKEKKAKPARKTPVPLELMLGIEPPGGTKTKRRAKKKAFSK